MAVTNKIFKIYNALEPRYKDKADDLLYDFFNKYREELGIDPEALSIKTLRSKMQDLEAMENSPAQRDFTSLLSKFEDLSRQNISYQNKSSKKGFKKSLVTEARQSPNERRFSISCQMEVYLEPKYFINGIDSYDFAPEAFRKYGIVLSSDMEYNGIDGFWIAEKDIELDTREIEKLLNCKLGKSQPDPIYEDETLYPISFNDVKKETQDEIELRALEQAHEIVDDIPNMHVADIRETTF